MTGRGVDQILPHPGDAELREPVVEDARVYRDLAESVNGLIPAPVDFAWPWGDALASLDVDAPDIRIVNLETSVTASDQFAAGKPVHYRMHPANLPCLTAGRVDVCALGNNHVLDFGREGLRETLEVLSGAEIAGVGAGRDAAEASRPATLPVGAGRVIVSSVGTPSSGIPHRWAAGADPGVNVLGDLSDECALAIAGALSEVKRPGDVAIVSIHWGSNWGFEVGEEQVRFAHRLVDGGVDVVHGHSSHHPRPIEVYRDRLVLYGCGGLIDDYEGIPGHEEYRADLRILYLASLERATGALLSLRMVPLQARRLRLRHAPASDVAWLRDVLNETSLPLGCRVALESPGVLTAGVEPGRAGRRTARG